MSIKDDIYRLKYENWRARNSIANLQLTLLALCAGLLILLVVLAKTNIDREHHLKELQYQINDNRDSMRRNAVRIVHLEEEDRVMREKVGIDE
ncbi:MULTISPECIES: hypothetical protein [Streptococcus]|uniref:hypothetical protein n=1 Tax=Streptococcus TaxID=1301 RepID=UPI00066011CA|nr:MULTISPECIES: hypothetical protein [Streptococcus]